MLERQNFDVFNSKTEKNLIISITNKEPSLFPLIYCNVIKLFNSIVVKYNTYKFTIKIHLGIMQLISFHQDYN